MNIRAAVVRSHHNLAVEEIELDPPQSGELLVQIKAAGVCHSDLHTLEGELRTPPPLVLGHEGAGVVVDVGPGVTRFAPGDRVLINWLPGCDTCPNCRSGAPNLCERFPTTTFRGRLPGGATRMHLPDGTELSQMLSSGTMATHTVVAEEGAVPLQDGVPFEVGAIIGCAVITGVGAVINTAQAQAGLPAAVIGLGGVGLSELLGCLLVGCTPVVAVDVVPEKLERARRLGATHAVNASDGDPVEVIKEITGGGAMYVFDSVGSAHTIAQAVRVTRPTGATVITGMHDAFAEVPVPVGTLVFENKRLFGSFAGSARPHVDLPRLQALYRSGQLPLDDLITNRYALDELPRAFEDMRAGQSVRSVLMFE